ncbi:hypothetical protein, variant [Phytophthora nicotianae CJ01A1]|uniref:Thioredoxin domain-containing protein n=6 Tax=Phytophthora nicotianae TaxID=4792 RepID=W2RBY0_PHYN3|nr:hypothetical protein, variant [Phytophthora nicotianae INRA-310]ETI49802.1 hypothetical protein, variant [Phytophthora nicotianae P1569]ETK89566.1 hypothetical protein, variant [Phytophthora nicotianae]ETO78358.1 hypothetical protein, variant [Phytophthora nicotianae P1976]ETP19439.1 hypothetical protein, variant [Phytophthora nicotianae CJ01A1]ETP47358.1 hypothetical protein, variant [Phytophthora nicotianae P10297]
MMWKVFSSRESIRVLRGSRALSSSARSRVKIIGSDEAYTQIVTEGTGRKAIVYFTAKWCPPCKMVGPIYDELRWVLHCMGWIKHLVDVVAMQRQVRGHRFCQAGCR